jgi:hypothetical protein
MVNCLDVHPYMILYDYMGQGCQAYHLHEATPLAISKVPKRQPKV